MKMLHDGGLSGLTVELEEMTGDVVVSHRGVIVSIYPTESGVGVRSHNSQPKVIVVGENPAFVYTKKG